MRRYPSTSRTATASTGKLFWDHEVNRYPFSIEPGSRLIGAVEARSRHGVVDERLVCDRARVERDVTVFRCLRECHPETAGSKVDRLRPDQDERLPVLGQRLGRVQKRRPGTDEQIATTLSRTVHVPPSI